MGENVNRDNCLLLVMATVYAFGGTLLVEIVAQNPGNYTDVVPLKEVTTTKAVTGNDSESEDYFHLPWNDYNWNSGNGAGPAGMHNGFIDWVALEEYWSTLLNYSTLPDDDETKTFIMKYPNDLQRQILAMQLSYCPFIPLCSHSLNVSEEFPIGSCCQSCSCDHNCIEYNNCCLDIMLGFHNTSTVQRTKSCIPLFLNTNLWTSPYNIAAYAVADCPATSTYVDREKCEESYYHDDVTMADILPVWHNSSGVVYRNMHCALCNGVHSQESDFFKAKVGCYGIIPSVIQTDSELIQYVLASNDCDISFRPEPFEPEYCQYSNIVSSCNVTGQWTKYDPAYELGCTLYTSEVKPDDGMLFKNVFCAFCNGYTDIPRKCHKYSFDYDRAIPFSFSGLLTFAATDDSEDKSAGDRKCSSGFIYHDTADLCIQASCSSLRRLVGNQCVAITDVVNVFNYEAVLRLTPSVTHTIVESFDMSDHVVMELKQFLKTLVEHPYDLFLCSADIRSKSSSSCILGTQDIFLQHFDHFLLKLNFRITGDHQPDYVVSKLSEKIRFDISNITDIENETMTVNLVNDYASVFEQNTSEMCSSFDDKILIPLNPPTPAIDICHYQIEYEPVSSLLKCPMVQVSNDSYPWTVSDDGVLFTQSGHIFNHTQFYLPGGNDTALLLCKNQYFELTTKSDARRLALSVEHIISIACVSLSIVSLLFTLVAFSILAPLRSLPGRNNMALVSVLLIAQTLYLIGSFSGFEQGSVTCKLVGILTHFFWLLVVFWMNVCTFHMFHVLTKTKVMAQRSGNKRYFAYHVYCIIFSAAFVGINVLVSSVKSGYNDIGYGVESCYVSSQEMLIYTFAMPLALVVVSNLGMFLVVIVTIKKSSAVQKNVKNERNDIAVFARLSTLTGATWIVGFIYTWTLLSVFSYIFIILNAGQGVFLFMSFICTRRVITLAKQKYSKSSFATISSMGHTLSTDAS